MIVIASWIIHVYRTDWPLNDPFTLCLSALLLCSIFLLWQYPLQEEVQRRRMASMPSQCCKYKCNIHATALSHVRLCVCFVAPLFTDVSVHTDVMWTKHIFSPHLFMCFMTRKKIKSHQPLITHRCILTLTTSVALIIKNIHETALCTLQSCVSWLLNTDVTFEKILFFFRFLVQQLNN